MVFTKPKGDATIENNVYQTKNYTQFTFLIANRSTSRAHINSLKEAIKAHPEILQSQPLLVNDKMQIIDGQHRFIAASEADMPITYVVVPGVGIEVARAMNVLQRKWEPQDFAKSYAVTGNQHYKIYVKVSEDFEELQHGIILLFLNGRNYNGINAEFKRGLFEVSNEQEARDWLTMVLEIRELSPIPVSKPFANALLVAFKNPDFDIVHFLERLKENGKEYLRRSTTVEDYLRMIERTYNHNLSKNKIRLY